MKNTLQVKKKKSNDIWKNLTRYEKDICISIAKNNKRISKQRKQWKFQRVEVIAELATPVAFYEDITLDGILSHAQKRYVIGQHFYDTHSVDLGITTEFPLPIKKDVGVYICSRPQYEKLYEGSVKWRKKFDEHMAEDFVDSNKQIYTTRGKLKEYNQKLRIVLIERISWTLIGDKEPIKQLLTRVNAIGKKTSQGYGVVKKWIVRDTNKNITFLYPVKESNIFKTYKLPYYRGDKASFVNYKTV